MNNKGFTLIELLIVVLIIGILTAIAVPQYQKSVDRSKFMQAVTLGKKIWEAQQRYQLAHGVYATHFEELDLDMPKPRRESYDDRSGHYYYYTWGMCWIVYYTACQANIGNGSARYFVENKKTNHSCSNYSGKRGKDVCEWANSTLF